VALLRSDVQAHADNAMMALASATAQGVNNKRDIEKEARKKKRKGEN
jgi:hypothetical protein